MSNSEVTNNQPAKNPGSVRISRKAFLKDISLFSVTAIAATSLLKGCSYPPAVPAAVPPASDTPQVKPPSTAPVATSQITVMEALKNRKSATSFQSQPLPKDKLLELLWAAWGINRPDSGKRTAPTAVNAQEIDIYVLLADGSYVYDARENRITPLLAEDLRAKAAPQGSLKEAPAHLIFVADYSKFRNIPQQQRELYSASHTGFIGQNVYLYCASQGLGARFYAGVDRAVLKTSLKLREEQAVVFAQAVGYAK
jgi:nitroreductase